MKVRLPTGDEVELLNATPEDAEKHRAFMNARFRFAMQYAAQKGWPEIASQLTIKQILEIRSQPGWETPEGVEPIPQEGEDL